MESICMKSHNLFPGKNKKNIMNVSFAELAKRVVKVNIPSCMFIHIQIVLMSFFIQT